MAGENGTSVGGLDRTLRAAGPGDAESAQPPLVTGTPRLGPRELMDGHPYELRVWVTIGTVTAGSAMGRAQNGYPATA
jgi:hypothetical protein